MKRTNRKFLLLAVSFLLTAMVFLTMPVASMAADTYYEGTEKNLVVSATNIVIDSADANGVYSPTYEMTFIAENASFSAYEMSFRMPYFVNVQNVCATPKMDGMTNATFTYYVDDSGLINVSYSCADNTNNVDIFTVYFTVNDYSVNIGSIDFLDAHFVDVNVNDVPVSFTYSTIEITNRIVMGDVDNDGIVTLSDLLIIQQSMVNPYYGLTTTQFTAADIDKDGYITIRDCQYIQNYLVGRIGSLDDLFDNPIAPNQYYIEVIVTNEVGEQLITFARTVMQGNLYSDLVSVAMNRLNKNYNVEEVLRAYSDYYGIIGLDVSGDVYTAQANDRLVISVKATPKEREAKFTYSATTVNADGSYMVVDSYFYYDGTALFTMKEIVGEKVVNSAEQRTEWYLDGSYLVVVIPEMGSQIMFIVSEDGRTLIPYEDDQPDQPDQPGEPEHEHHDKNDDMSCDRCGEWCDDGHDVHYDNDNDAHCDFCGMNLGGYGCAHRDADDNYICDYCGAHWDDGQDVWEEQDYIQYVEHEIVIGITVGTDPSVFMEMACENYVTVHYSISGEQRIYLTPDMIDYSDVDFNTVGNYRARVMLRTADGIYDLGFDVCVMPDMSEVGVRGVYSFSEEIRELIEINSLTLYADGTLIIDNFYVTSYFEIEDGVIAFGIEGGDLVVRLNDESETVDFYVPTEDTFIGEYTYFYNNGPTIVFTVYGDYTGAGDYVALYEIGYDGYYACVTSRVFLDLENNTIKHGVFSCETIITEGNIIIENHEIVVRVEAPTCEWYGYEIHECNKCGRQVSRVEIAPLGHTFNEEGYCENCGFSNKTDPDFEVRKEQALFEIENEWMMLSERYGELLMPYESNYMRIYDMIVNSTDVYQIDKYLSTFYRLVEDLHSKLDNTHVYPLNHWIEGNIPTAVTQGEMNIDEFIENYIIGSMIVINMSDGQVLHIPVESYMISGWNGDFNQLGTVYIDINCAQADFSVGLSVSVNVLPNLSDVELVGTYYFQDTVGTGWSYIDLYANGIMVAGDEVYNYVFTLDNVIDVDMDGAPIVLALDNSSMTAYFYKPEDKVIGVYTMSMGKDNTLVFTVYGEYNGCGQYLAELTMRLGDGEGGIKQEATVATRLELDLEKCYIYHGGFGMLFFDENGNISNGNVEPDHPEDDFEYQRDMVINEIKMLWSDVEMSGYMLGEEHYTRYNEIMDRVYAVKEMWELYDLLEQARQLCNQIRGIREIMYISHDGFPYRVIAGITYEDLYQMFGNARFTVHFSDGSQQEFFLSEDMLDLSNIDLNTPGEYEYYVRYQLEGFEEQRIERFHLEVIENLGEGEGVEYTYIARIENAQNAAEWTSIVLYENGYALFMEGTDARFAPYSANGDVIFCDYYGVALLLVIVRDANGEAVGMSYYRAETEQIYVYDDGEMYIGFEVFEFDGKFYAFFDAREYYDEYIEYYEVTAEITFNENGDKFYSPVMDSWFIIAEDNTVIPTECEHVFDENARCIYCGDREGGNTDKECDHVFDEKGCCMHCGMYIGVENVCNHVINEKNYCIYCGMYFEYVVNHVDYDLNGICDDCGIDLSFGYGENGDISFDDASGEANFGGVSGDSSYENSENGYIVNKIA